LGPDPEKTPPNAQNRSFPASLILFIKNLGRNHLL
jgi:hypothetical protein